MSNAKIEQLKELKAQQLAILKGQKSYEEMNRLEFFGRAGSSLQPNPPQVKILQAFQDPHYSIFCFTGGNRSSKTATGTILALAILFGETLWDGRKIIFSHNKPRKIRVVGQDFEKHINRVVVPALHEWWPENRPKKIKKNSLGVEAFWTDTKTGSTLEIMSDRQDTDLHEGWHGDWVWADEPIRRDIWIANSRGLVDRRGRAFFGMTLLKQAWIDRDIIRRVDEKGMPDTSVYTVNATIYDNVGFGITMEGVEQYAKELSPDERKSRLLGIPAYKQGLVLKEFDRNIHIKERFSIPTDWPVDIAIDIHPRKKQCVLFQATSPRNMQYACFEIFENGDGTAIANEIIRVISRNALRINRIIIDPLSKADPNADKDGLTTYEKIKDVFFKHDYILEVASKDKTSGILDMNSGLKGPNNEPSLFVFRDMVRTIHDWEGWTYLDKGDDKGKPSKVDDDFCENAYRLALLGTEYFPPEDEEDEDDRTEDSPVDSHTGY